MKYSLVFIRDGRTCCSFQEGEHDTLDTAVRSALGNVRPPGNREPFACSHFIHRPSTGIGVVEDDNHDRIVWRITWDKIPAGVEFPRTFSVGD